MPKNYAGSSECVEHWEDVLCEPRATVIAGKLRLVVQAFMSKFSGIRDKADL